MVKRHSGGLAIVVIRHDSDVGLIWWADLVGLGGDCGSAVCGFDLVGEWVDVSGSWLFVLEVPQRWWCGWTGLSLVRVQRERLVECAQCWGFVFLFCCFT